MSYQLVCSIRTKSGEESGIVNETILQLNTPVRKVLITEWAIGLKHINTITTLLI